MKKSIQLSSLAILLVVSGCVAPPPAAPRTTSISARVPTVQTVAETKEAQEKGGLEIAVVPAAYKAVKKDRTTLEQIEPPAISIILSSPDQRNNQIFVEERTTPYLETEPHRLQFSVRVNNKLSRVFRGQGAVVQFNVGGKLIPFDRVDYKEFLNGIVPPRNEAEFTIYGPTLDMLPDTGTVGIFLYDVVTATDVAGNVTEKQNFEWYFTYTTRTEEQSAPWVLKQGWMNATVFQQRKMQEQMEAAQAARAVR